MKFYTKTLLARQRARVAEPDRAWRNGALLRCSVDVFSIDLSRNTSTPSREGAKKK
jgi:hypothetical protein